MLLGRASKPPAERTDRRGGRAADVDLRDAYRPAPASDWFPATNGIGAHSVATPITAPLKSFRVWNSSRMLMDVLSAVGRRIGDIQAVGQLLKPVAGQQFNPVVAGTGDRPPHEHFGDLKVVR